MIDDQIRKYVRAEVTNDDSVEVKITRIATNTKGIIINPIVVRPINISARGVKIESHLVFTTGIMIDLWIRIEDKEVTTTGKIVRMEPAGDKSEFYHYGISFSLLNEFNRIIIASFVKKKTIDHIQHLRGQ